MSAPVSQPAPIGIVGLGLMGSAMAGRLVQHGYDVLGYDLDARRGVGYLDGTVSGNSEQLAAGDVLWMVGAEAEALARCADVLAVMGRQVIHTGAAGTGAQMKLVTNLVLGLNRAALAEGLALAEGM